MALDAVATAGGMAILWNPKEVIFEHWYSLPRILSGLFRLVGMEDNVLIIGVYGPHNHRERHDFLNNIYNMRSLIPNILWIIGGDFNMIRDLREKRGGIRREDQNMEEFNDMIRDLRLVDIPTNNGVHTWNNRRGGQNQIASRLDRFLLSEEILNQHMFIEAKILPSLGSYHWPIRLDIDIKKFKGKKPFRFESFWLRDPQFIKKVQEWWNQSTVRGKGKMHTLQLKLKEIKRRIKEWNRKEFGNIMEAKQKLEREMEDIQQKIILEGRDDDSTMIQHRQRNRIYSIKNAEGDRVIEQEEIEKILVDYFKGILTENQRDRGEAINNICREIPRLVTVEQNMALMRAVTMEELGEVVMNMSKNKAPGPDGYTVEFFQASWNFMGKDILEAVEESRMRQRIWPEINSTFLTLIPKSNNSEEPHGFRPIALCNVVYKIISTLIVKRLKPLLPNLIAPEQTGFVEGRQILDGIVVSQEVIHSLKMNKQKGMLMKLDLSKAYDRLNWDYLRAVLEAYSFERRWIAWIISMISTPNFSILLNGIPTNPFNSSRGIRQGDPISSFLFILAMEGLSRKIK
eukprot:PITA_29063